MGISSQPLHASLSSEQRLTGQMAPIEPSSVDSDAGGCDERSDRLIELFANHTPPSYYQNMLDACTYLLDRHARANQHARSAMWLRVYEGLHARFPD